MKKFLALIPIVLLAACGGGGGGGSLPSTPVTASSPPANGGGSGPSPKPSASPTSAPTQSPTPVPTVAPTATPGSSTVSFTVNLPLNDRGNYMQNPTVFGVRLLSANGFAQNVVTTRSTSCGSKSCKVSVTAPVGNDTFSMTYAIGANGSTGSGLEPLAYGGNVAVSVANGSTNTATMNLQGVPAYYELDAVGNGPWTSSMPLYLRFADDSNVCTPPQVIYGCTIGTFIPGTYATPVTVTDTDASGQTALSLNHGAPARMVTVTKASDSVTLLIHGGANVPQAYVTPNASSFSASEFGSAYTSITQQPWVTQDPNGLGFSCSSGSCQTTGPTSITIQ